MDPQEIEVLQDPPETPVFPETLAHPDPCLTLLHGCLSCPSLKAVRRAPSQTPSATYKHRLAPLAPVVPTVPLVQLVPRASRECEVSLVTPAPSVLVDLQDLVVCQASLARTETTVRMAPQVPRDLSVPQAPEVFPVCQVSPA